jgi:cysteinyl-tRNA synthetase
MALHLYNTLAGKKQEFVPADKDNVGMYVCGPTVYDRPHLGNARSTVVYDVLYRVLQHHYGADGVTYVRNITDVDDKINKQAAINNEPIADLSVRVTKWFHEDMAALNNVSPNIEPRATDHINEIVSLIERLIGNGNAYESAGHVLFAVDSVGQQGDYFYGKLSGKKLEDLIAGARVDVEDYKRNAGDFVLWKPSSENEPGWESPWGRGRPGWHIECSAMSTKYLGENFDIHGGGADLKFPHHENEIAQSCCGNAGSSYAATWVHNGFLTVNGEKMSKSLGNFITVSDLLEKGINGETIRYVYLGTHYRKPLDYSEKALGDAKKNLDNLYRAIETAQSQVGMKQDIDPSVQAAMVKRSTAAYEAFFTALDDDMNTSKALVEIYTMAKGIRSLDATTQMMEHFLECANVLGICQSSPADWFAVDVSDVDEAEVDALIAKRAQAKADKDWGAADAARDELIAMGIELKDGKDGTTWHKL